MKSDLNSHETQWLIRRSIAMQERDTASGTSISRWPEAREEFEILGPYLTDQIRSMVAEQMLSPDDEVSPENGYWFALHETVEVKKFLGLERVTGGAVRAFEPTLPDVSKALREQAASKLEHPDFSAEDNESTLVLAPKGEVLSGKVPSKPVAPTVPASGASVTKDLAAQHPKVTAPEKERGTITDLKSRFPRLSVAQQLGYYGRTGSPQLLGVEKSKVWSLLFFILAAIAIGGVIWVLRSLKP